MSTKIKLKRNYSIPEVERIQLDNEISLALESPPAYELAKNIKLQEFYNENPYKTDNV
jgi:hypothetical protein